MYIIYHCQFLAVPGAHKCYKGAYKPLAVLTACSEIASTIMGHYVCLDKIALWSDTHTIIYMIIILILIHTMKAGKT